MSLNNSYTLSWYGICFPFVQQRCIKFWGYLTSNEYAVRRRIRSDAVSGWDICQILSCHSAGDIEKVHEKSQCRQQMAGLKFKPCTVFTVVCLSHSAQSGPCG
jgi:hypothetical protein